MGTCEVCRIGTGAENDYPLMFCCAPRRERHLRPRFLKRRKINESKVRASSLQLFGFR
jgi:hypothetical protein